MPASRLPDITPPLSERRIVITGLGAVSRCGLTAEALWESLIASPNPEICPHDGPQGEKAAFQGRIDDFGELPQPLRKSVHKAIKVMNRETQMGVAAGIQALRDGQCSDILDPQRTGLCFGADNVSIEPADFLSGVTACSDEQGLLDMSQWGDRGLEEVAPLWLLKCLPNMPACHLAILQNVQGPGNTITQRDVSFHLAITEACRTIRDGQVDVMIVGATGTTMTAYNRLHAQLESELPMDAGRAICRPFDLHRSGAPCSEGAAAVILEDLETAQRRNAFIYGELLSVGHGSACGRPGAISKSLASAVRACLRTAGLAPEGLGHIHAHGLGTHASDLAESLAIGEVLGSNARKLPLVAVRSQVGHAGAGTAAIQLVSSLLALKYDRLFAVRGFETPDPKCCVRPVTNAGERPGDCFLSLSMFGRGLASCLAVGRFRG